MNTYYCSLLFKTVQDSQIFLTQELERMRKERSLTYAELNRDCHLDRELPLFEEVVDDPTLLNSTFLTRVMRGLNLRAGLLLKQAFREYLADIGCAQEAFARLERKGLSPCEFALYGEEEWSATAHSIMREIDEVSLPQVA